MIESTERWLPIGGWEDLYAVSDLGRVRSFPRQTRRGVRGGNILTPWIRPDGYPEVVITCAGLRYKRMVHHLVLETFIGPCPAGQEARHGPGGKLDARLVNLCWGTRAANVGPDRVRDKQSNRGERSGLAKLTWAQVVEIRARIADGETPTSVAHSFGRHVQTIIDVIVGKTWAYPPDQW